MKAGREIDALIHVEIFGLELLPLKLAPCPYCGDEMRYCGERSRCTPCREWRYGPAKEYSEDMACAWEVVEKLRADGFGFRLHAAVTGSWVRFSKKGRQSRKHGGATPLAICLAAIAAVGAAPPDGEGP